MIKCPTSNCNGTSFHMAEHTPSGSNYKLMAISCTKCGAVVNFHEYFNSGAKLVNIEEMLKKVAIPNTETRLYNIEARLYNITKALKIIAEKIGADTGNLLN